MFAKSAHSSFQICLYPVTQSLHLSISLARTWLPLCKQIHVWLIAMNIIVPLSFQWKLMSGQRNYHLMVYNIIMQMWYILAW